MKAKLTQDVNDPYVGTIAKDTDVDVEGLWHEITGGSWMDARGNIAAMNYALRSGFSGLPMDDNVYYGKINGLGFLLHESELQFV